MNFVDQQLTKYLEHAKTMAKEPPVEHLPIVNEQTEEKTEKSGQEEQFNLNAFLWLGE